MVSSEINEELIKNNESYNKEVYKRKKALEENRGKDRLDKEVSKNYE